MTVVMGLTALLGQTFMRRKYVFRNRIVSCNLNRLKTIYKLVLSVVATLNKNRMQFATGMSKQSTSIGRRSFLKTSVLPGGGCLPVVSFK
jgi:hypothetical protein